MPTVLKVRLDPKKPTQVQDTYDFTTGRTIGTATQYWNVIYDSAQWDPALVLNATDGTNRIPIVGTQYTGQYMYCNRILPQLDPQSAGKLYRVQVDYSSLPQAQQQASGKWEITVSIDGAGVTETIYRDSAGKAYVNSAGQAFQQQRTRTYFDNVYRVAFKSASLDVAALDAVQGKLNQSAFTLTVASLGFSKVFEAQSTELTRCPTSTVLTGDPTKPSFWQVEYELYYRKPIISPIDGSTVSGWTVFELDQGYCELVGGQLKAIMDTNTPPMPLNSPQYLNGSGAKSTTPVFLKFAPDQATADFTPLFAGIA